MKEKMSKFSLKHVISWPYALVYIFLFTPRALLHHFLCKADAYLFFKTHLGWHLRLKPSRISLPEYIHTHTHTPPTTTTKQREFLSSLSLLPRYIFFYI